MTSAAPENTRNRADALPKSWNPSAVEADLYKRWVDAGYFPPTRTSDKPGYSIVLPPPNVTGNLHMGHALDHTLMDALSRRKRMQGYEVLWLPGMDHAGIATQTVVEKQLAATARRRKTSAASCSSTRSGTGSASPAAPSSGQMRRIGDGVDWSRDRFTMDDGLSRAVQTIFKRLYDDGPDLPRRAAGQLVAGAADRASPTSRSKYEDVEGELVSLRYGSLERRRAARHGRDHPRRDDAR